MTGTSPSSDRARANRRAHLLDLVFFRVLATGMLCHETLVTPTAETGIIVGAICLFFMPDWLRGKDSLPAALLMKWLGAGDRS